MQKLDYAYQKRTKNARKVIKSGKKLRIKSV